MQKQLKIVHVITRFINGGADENTLLTCNGQAKLGHDVHLIVGAEFEPGMVDKLHPRVTLHFVHQLVRAVRPVTDLAGLLELTRMLRRLKADVVHTHESKAGILGRFAAMLARSRCIVHGVHILPFIGVSRLSALVFIALEKLAAGRTDAYIDVSEGMRDICLRHRLGRPENHFVVESGMDLSRYRTRPDPNPSDWRSHMPQLAEKPRWHSQTPKFALVAGTLEPRKRVLELLQALIKSDNGAQDWVLIVAGGGSQAPLLAEFVMTAGLEDRVVLLGHCDKLENYIAIADVCVHAAANEGLPRVVVQYVLAGRPVVSTALPGIERLIVDKRSGELVSVDDIQGLADRVLKLLGDPDCRQAYRAQAALVDLSAWDQVAMVKAIDRVYAQLIPAYSPVA